MQEVWKRQQVHEDASVMHRAKVPVKNFGKLGKLHLRGHDVVRRMSRQGGVVI